ncbi:MAG: lysylphosphatidylglycerol synthase transmembrane domain-containing protein [Arenicella sp.]
MSKAIRIIVTILLLALVIYLAGLFDADKRTELWQTLKNPDWFWLCVCVLVGFLVNFSSAIKWWMLANAGGLKIGLLRTWAYYMVGMFYNLIMPTSVGGDVVRAYELGKYSNNQAMSLASVFVERYTGVVVLLLLSLVAVFINATEFNVPIITYSLLAFSAALAGLGWLAFDGRSLTFFKKIFGGIHSLVDKIFAKVQKLHEAVLVYRKNKGALSWAFINSLVFYALAVLNVFTTAKVFNIDVDLHAIILATPVIMLLMNIPLSIGNHGIMEFAFTMTFELLGLGAILGLSTALLIRLKSFLDGAIGAILHPIYSTVSAKDLEQGK